MLKRIFKIFSVLIIITVPLSGQGTGDKLTSFVDPLIGTGDGGGAAFAGACLPFSMVRVGPDTPHPQNTTGYVMEKPVDGFSHTHVSGTGGPGKYGNILVAPQTGAVQIKNYSSDKSSEYASPGYYTVTLERWNVKAELTASERAAFHRYTYNTDDNALIIFDLARAVNVIEFAPGESEFAIIKRTDCNTIKGYGTYTGGWGPPVPFTWYFYAKTDTPVKQSGTWRNGKITENSSAAAGDSIGMYLDFGPQQGNSINMKVGISLLSIEQARKNLEKTGTKNFDEIKQEAENIWENKLSLIKIDGGTPDQKKLFYTSLYHSMLMPTDVTGENPRWESDEPHYWDYFAIWDTYRTVHPLLTLIQTDRQIDMIRSLVDTYEHTGWMPECWTSGVHGYMQGGTSCDILVADAMVRGLEGFDYEKAYEAIKKNADVPSDAPREYGRDSDEYLTLGYSSAEKWCGSSRTIEYSYNDFCVSEAAGVLGKKAEQAMYEERSLNCYNLFMPEEKFFWAKNRDGSWVEGFAPDFRIEEWWEGPYFYEGLPWHYLFAVPHDIGGLIKRHGGNIPFVKKLDKIFDENIYIQDNQPDILTPWLYIYAGRPDRTAERVRYILAHDYETDDYGLPGQDDAGCMSAWYVFSAMGFYPNAGQDIYFIGSPLLDKSVLNLGDGKEFVIEANNLSDKNIYVTAAKLNGKEWNKAWFRYSDIKEGARLELVMGSEPNGWGRNVSPPSVTDGTFNIPEVK